MNNHDTIPNETLKGAYLAPADAAQAIACLRTVLSRLDGRTGNRLQACIGFAQEALWAASYPDVPNSMLELIAYQAEDAMG
jgi:hypothetical protein